VRLDVRGAAEITAGDIECPADVEILNKDLHIASVNGKGRLAIEDTVDGLCERTGTRNVEDAFIKAVGGDIGSGEIEWLHNSSN